MAKSFGETLIFEPFLYHSYRVIEGEEIDVSLQLNDLFSICLYWYLATTRNQPFKNYNINVWIRPKRSKPSWKPYQSQTLPLLWKNHLPTHLRTPHQAIPHTPYKLFVWKKYRELIP